MLIPIGKNKKNINSVLKAPQASFQVYEALVRLEGLLRTFQVYKGFSNV